MRILLAPDSYKECMDAACVAAAMADAVRQVRPDWETLEMPLADGGEGTVSVLTRALGGKRLSRTVTGPLGQPVEAFYGVAGDVAILEVAAACGLSLVPPERRNPLLTTTRGVGELLLAALEQGCRRILVGLGGSATCDGGEGMLSVPGLAERAAGANIEVLCDVDTPFVGPLGAARVFGPQKGATPVQVEQLEERMVRQAGRIRQETGIDITDVPGAGAAGGLGGAMLACLGARLVPGADTVMAFSGFDRACEGCDLIVTGEGKSDSQTLAGKVPQAVLKKAKSIPVALVSGRIEDRGALSQAGFRYLAEATPRSLPLQEALRTETARHNLQQAVSELISSLEGR
ncbi:MAG: glycerate kinase [Bacteroidales bacterium]|nr:glycerate kinase [Bacteroidales bacterium]